MNHYILECALVGQTFETRKRTFLAAPRFVPKLTLCETGQALRSLTASLDHMMMAATTSAANVVGATIPRPVAISLHEFAAVPAVIVVFRIPGAEIRSHSYVVEPSAGALPDDKRCASRLKGKLQLSVLANKDPYRALSTGSAEIGRAFRDNLLASVLRKRD